MSLFRSRKKFTISERDPSYKVRYLGNVQTALMKGEGCVDKPTAVLWNNLVKNTNVGIDMLLTVTASGLKALTSQQGLTEYRAHRISYCIAHPSYPKLFVWVYRHEGKRMKVELRCHAALCTSDSKAKAIAVQLHDKLAMALSEFMREKSRRQTSRMLATHQLPGSPTGVPLRTKMLSTGQNFKPPIEKSASAPKLGNISEVPEPEEEGTSFACRGLISRQQSSVSEASSLPDDMEDMKMEIGNDIAALKKERGVQYILNHLDDSDDNSSESGFSEQDRDEALSAGSGGSGGSAEASTPTVISTAAAMLANTHIYVDDSDDVLRDDDCEATCIISAL